MQFFKRNKVVFGILFILLSVLIKVFFYHQYRYWNITVFLSIVFCIAGALCFHELINQHFLKYRDTYKGPVKFLTSLMKVSAMFVFIWVLDVSSKELNYSLWEYYLNKNSEEVSGMFIGEKRVGSTRSEKARFYIVEYELDKKKVKVGVPVNYQNRENPLPFKLIIQDDKGYTIKKFNNSKVRIKYSKKHPTFIKILNFE